jgi:hypothetical protein
MLDALLELLGVERSCRRRAHGAAPFGWVR